MSTTQVQLGEDDLPELYRSGRAKQQRAKRNRIISYAVGVGVVVVVALVGDWAKIGRLYFDWDTAKEVPWGILILFAGGICLAEGIRQSGLSEIAAGSLKHLANLPLLLLVVVVCLVMTFLTELTSNTASTILMMPILGSAAVANGLDPKLLMLPAALSASCAFMLPVATAPNAVVFGTGHLTVQRMVREGVVLNLIGVVVISLYCWLMSR